MYSGRKNVGRSLFVLGKGEAAVVANDQRRRPTAPFCNRELRTHYELSRDNGLSDVRTGCDDGPFVDHGRLGHHRCALPAGDSGCESIRGTAEDAARTQYGARKLSAPGNGSACDDADRYAAGTLRNSAAGRMAVP